MRLRDIVTRSLPLAGLILAACSGAKSPASRLKDQPSSAATLKAKVYTLRETKVVNGLNQTIQTPALLVGPYPEADGKKSYRAWIIKNCATSQAVYDLLGIDGGNLANPRLITDSELRSALKLQPTDDLNTLGYRTIDWRNVFHLDDQSFSCSTNDKLSSDWFWDLDTNSYFPNSDQPTFYTKVDERLCPRLYNHLSNSMTNASINSLDIAQDVTKPIYEMACGDENITPFKETWGWELRWTASQQFYLKEGDGAPHFQGFLVLSKIEDGKRVYLPLMGMQNQIIGLSASSASYTPEFKSALTFLRQSGLRITANINDSLTVETMSNAERDEFFRNITQYPILHLCPLGAGAANCQPKVSWLKPTDTTNVFSLVEGRLSLSEQTKIGKTLVPLLGLGKPDATVAGKFNYEYSAFDACPGLQTADVFQLAKKALPTDEQSQKLNFDAHIAKIIAITSRPIVPQRRFTCQAPETKVCEVAVNNEADLRRALSAPACLPDATDLRLSINADIALTAPLKASALANFKNVEIEGKAVPTDDQKSTRWPRLQKTFGSNTYLAFIELTNFRQLVLRNLQINSDRTSGFATGLKLARIENLKIEQLTVDAADAAKNFSIGLLVENSQGYSDGLQLQATDLAFSSEKSLLNFLGGPTSLAGEYGFISSNSALYLDQLTTTAKIGGEFWNGSAAYIESLKSSGNGNGFASAFDFQDGYSRLVVKKADLDHLFTPVNIGEGSYMLESNNTQTASRISLLATCSDVQNAPRTYCK